MFHVPNTFFMHFSTHMINSHAKKMSSTFETLLGTELTSAAADTSATVDKMADVDAVLLYFSAHWCPPCRGA
jgi:hypothetical protein